MLPVLLVETMNSGDVGVVEGGQELRLTLEAGHAIWPLRHLSRQDLDRHLSLELRILRPIHLSHPTLPERGEDLEDAEAGSGGEGHCDCAPDSTVQMGKGACVRGSEVLATLKCWSSNRARVRLWLSRLDSLRLLGAVA